MSHRIVVLYHGRVMEQGPAAAVYDTPGHPYTRALLQAVPEADPVLQAARRVATAEAAAARSAPMVADRGTTTGCPFAGRCPYVIPGCLTARPPLTQAPGGTEVACIRAHDIPADVAAPSRKPAPSRNEISQ